MAFCKEWVLCTKQGGTAGIYFSGFVKTDLSVPERKLGEAYGSPKILFHRKMRPMK